MNALESIRFFEENAGFSWNPKAQTREEGRRLCAVELARAEDHARELEITFTWTDDWSLGTSHADFYSREAYPEGDPETCESCVATLEGEVVASLGCIDGATPEYRRVVEAELALEAIPAVLASSRGAA